MAEMAEVAIWTLPPYGLAKSELEAEEEMIRLPVEEAVPMGPVKVEVPSPPTVIVEEAFKTPEIFTLAEKEEEAMDWRPFKEVRPPTERVVEAFTAPPIFRLELKEEEATEMAPP